LKGKSRKRLRPKASGIVHINDAAHLLDKVVELSNTIFPTNYEKLAFQEAVKRAKREAALETAIEESILLNPERLRELREKLLTP